ncbi:MAG: cytochrome C oxidase subunit IV family protein [Acidobacteria bacterium]|nr:cytochrome C oxidase subunit IV family protein [Acidobacteriota bacterium]MBV9481823.1 cytochrome C oxidase subunit IV family protein [Acidobacteriota bacterium]
MSAHIASKKLYVTIWASLIGLTILTAAVSYLELGAFNIVLALVIATAKMLLVALFFMGVKYISEKMTLVVIVAGLFWLMILLILSMTDYISRPWI